MFFYSRRSWLRSGFLAWLCLVVIPSAIAQTPPPNDWWIHIANDRVPQVQRMLSQGVDPNVFGKQGLPAAMFAVTEGAWNVYDVLVAHPRTDIHLENGSQENLLMYVCLAGDARRVEALIERGASVNRLGWTPLMYAASAGRESIVNVLLKHGAIVNSPGPKGESALMMAALGGHEGVVRQLLAAGADPTMRDLEGRSAADWARMKNHTSLASRLDDLDRKVLAKREALRHSATTTVPTPAVNQPPIAETTGDTSTRASEASGTQRYFDLQRFESEADDITP